jgi:hypothetical protein
MCSYLPVVVCARRFDLVELAEDVSRLSSERLQSLGKPRKYMTRTSMTDHSEGQGKDSHFVASRYLRKGLCKVGGMASLAIWLAKKLSSLRMATYWKRKK